MKIYNNYPGPTQHTDIDPDLYYVQGRLTNICYENGDRAFSDLIKAMIAGSITRFEDDSGRGPRRCLWLGKDVIRFLKHKSVQIRSAYDFAVKRAKSLSIQDIAKIIQQNKLLTDENKKLVANRNKVRNAAIQLKTQQDSYQRYIDRQKKEIKDEEHQQELLREQIIKKIFGQTTIFEFSMIAWKELVGVYILFENDQPVYVGQSKSNILTRVRQHVNDGKKFDMVRFFHCPKENIDEREMFLIKLLKPKLNGQYKNKNTLGIKEILLNEA